MRRSILTPPRGAERPALYTRFGSHGLYFCYVIQRRFPRQFAALNSSSPSCLLPVRQQHWPGVLDQILLFPRGVFVFVCSSFHFASTAGSLFWTLQGFWNGFDGYHKSSPGVWVMDVVWDNSTRLRFFVSTTGEQDGWIQGFLLFFYLTEKKTKLLTAAAGGGHRLTWWSLFALGGLFHFRGVVGLEQMCACVGGVLCVLVGKVVTVTVTKQSSSELRGEGGRRPATQGKHSSLCLPCTRSY